MQKNIWNRTVPLAVLLSIVIPLAGCTSEAQVIGVTGGDMIENARANEQALIEGVRASETEAFNKHFSNGLYWETFEEQEHMLNEAFHKVYEKQFGTTKRFNYFCMTKNEYYKESLKKLKNGELTVEQIIENPKDHIWKMRFQVVGAEKQDSDDIRNIWEPSMWELYVKFNKIQRASGIHEMENWYVRIWNDVGATEVVDIAKKDDPIFFIMNNINTVDIWIGKLADDRGVNGIVRDDLLQLKKKYNEEFEWVGVGTNENESMSNLYAPIRDHSLKFMVGYMDNEDKYLTVLAQRAMYEEIEKIIKEEGYGGRIAHLTTPDVRYSDSIVGAEMDIVTLDMSKKCNNKEIIDKVFTGTYDTSLSLMLNENEKIDYKKLKRICARISGLCPTNYDKDRNYGTRNETFIYFNRLNEGKRKIVMDMFSREWCTENYFRESSTLANMWDNMERERAETTGFHYLDVFGNRETQYLHICRNKAELETMKVEEFKNLIGQD